MSKNNFGTKKNDNKVVNIFITIGIIFLIGSLVLMFTKKEGSDNHIEEINYSKYTDIIKEDKYNIILLTSPTCSHCVNYKPYVNLVADKYDLTVYNINLDNLDYDDYVTIHDSYEATRNNYSDGNIPSIPTPATIITKNGKEVTSILGDIGESGFTNLLKTNKVIK